LTSMISSNTTMRLTGIPHMASVFDPKSTVTVV
jgi:hypothetical protein